MNAFLRARLNMYSRGILQQRKSRSIECFGDSKTCLSGHVFDFRIYKEEDSSIIQHFLERIIQDNISLRRILRFFYYLYLISFFEFKMQTFLAKTCKLGSMSVIRNTHLQHTRKTSRKQTMQDQFQYLLISSNPIINQYIEEKKEPSKRKDCHQMPFHF